MSKRRCWPRVLWHSLVSRNERQKDHEAAEDAEVDRAITNQLAERLADQGWTKEER